MTERVPKVKLVGRPDGGQIAVDLNGFIGDALIIDGTVWAANGNNERVQGFGDDPNGSFFIYCHG